MYIDCFRIILKKMPTIITSAGWGLGVDCSLSPSPNLIPSQIIFLFLLPRRSQSSTAFVTLCLLVVDFLLGLANGRHQQKFWGWEGRNPERFFSCSLPALVQCLEQLYLSTAISVSSTNTISFSAIASLWGLHTPCLSPWLFPLSISGVFIAISEFKTSGGEFHLLPGYWLRKVGNLLFTIYPFLSFKYFVVYL